MLFGSRRKQNLEERQWPDMKFREVFYPIIISSARLLESFTVTNTKEELTLGAGLSLTQVKDILDVVPKFTKEKSQMYCALLKHLRTLAGQQIRNMADPCAYHDISKKLAS
ncbi:aldehyde oxidase 3-like isoform 1-T2 [Callospermophilus lateralis]